LFEIPSAFPAVVVRTAASGPHTSDGDFGDIVDVREIPDMSEEARSALE